MQCGNVGGEKLPHAGIQGFNLCSQNPLDGAGRPLRWSPLPLGLLESSGCSEPSEAPLHQKLSWTLEAPFLKQNARHPVCSSFLRSLI